MPRLLTYSIHWLVEKNDTKNYSIIIKLLNEYTKNIVIMEDITSQICKQLSKNKEFIVLWFGFLLVLHYYIPCKPANEFIVPKNNIGCHCFYVCDTDVQFLISDSYCSLD